PDGPAGVPAVRAGWDRGVRCLCGDGPLMLVMFGLGGGVVPMGVLTVVMVAERSPRLGRHVATAAGVGLLVGAALVALNPAWFPTLFDREAAH
ncbi:MAG: DUF2182 domain-containing protein, partial [Acidimicrobiales bacterium]